MQPNIEPQEIYLLELYVSLDYFGEMRDAWANMVTHVESCLQAYMAHLPPDYRSRKLPEQPDVVWGEHVLPNFRDTLQSLNTGYILLSHGDFNGLKYSHGPSNDFRGQMDYWSGWMSEAENQVYHELLHQSVTSAFNMSTTEGGYWDPTDLTTRCDAKEREILAPPEHWPTYQISRDVSVASGHKLSQAGIYVPDLDNSCAQFLSPSHHEAPLAKVLVEVRDLVDPDSGEKYDDELIISDEPCVWYLVQRTSENNLASFSHSTSDAKRNRTQAGQQCVETGFYFTPARAASRRHFMRGELMPDLGTKYGTTIWQWDANQD